MAKDHGINILMGQFPFQSLGKAKCTGEEEGFIMILAEKETHKIQILEHDVPETRIKGKKYGPYKKGDIIEVPHHIAVFLLCREVAKLS